MHYLGRIENCLREYNYIPSGIENLVVHVYVFIFCAKYRATNVILFLLMFSVYILWVLFLAVVVVDCFVYVSPVGTSLLSNFVRDRGKVLFLGIGI